MSIWINICGAIIFTAMTVFAMPKLIAKWFCVRRVYGHIPWTLSRDMWQYNKKSYNSFFVYLFLIGIVVSVSAMFREIVRGDLSYDHILLNLAFLLWALEKIARIIVPPTILFLGTSNEEISINLKEFRKISNYRTVTLINPSVDFEISFFRRLSFYNYLRARTHYQWRSIVFHLMDVVPVIVFDAKCNTDFIKEERKRIERCHYLYKTIFVTSTREDPDTINDKNVRTVERRALSSSIRNYLKNIDDTQIRSHRQADFNNMLKVIPKKCRYPKTEYELVLKAQIMAAYGRQQFLRFCKGIQPEEDNYDLIEDTPSQVSRDDELRYLRESRALEEAEILLNSVQEELLENPDENNDFNMGNLCNKFAQIARIKREWEKAIKLSKEAMGHLNPLMLNPQRKDEATREIATTHFIMGEVYMARFRDLNESVDRSRAIDNFNRSIIFDREVSGDISIAERRLRALT